MTDRAPDEAADPRDQIIADLREQLVALQDNQALRREIAELREKLNQNSQNSSPGILRPRTSGSVLKGCLIAVAVMAVLIAAGAFFLYKRTDSFIQEMTREPIPLPPVPSPEAVAKGLTEKVLKAGTELKDRPTTDVVLTQDEVNQLLAEHLNDEIKGAVHVTLEGSAVRLRAPVPGAYVARHIPDRHGYLKDYIAKKVKFLNLDARLAVSVVGGKAVMKVTEVLQPAATAGASFDTLIQDFAQRFSEQAWELPLKDGRAKIQDARVENGQLKLTVAK